MCQGLYCGGSLIVFDCLSFSSFSSLSLFLFLALYLSLSFSLSLSQSHLPFPITLIILKLFKLGALIGVVG